MADDPITPPETDFVFMSNLRNPDPNHWSNQVWDPNEPSFFEMLIEPHEHEHITEVNANRAGMSLPPLTEHPTWIAKWGIYEPPPPEPVQPDNVIEFPQSHKEFGPFDLARRLTDEPIRPPREWILGNLFCVGFLSSLLGDGATGKTAFRVACALSMAADRGDIVGEHVFRACKVLYLSFEDGEEEILRRFQAAMKYHNVSVEDIAGSLFVQAITQHDMKLAMQKRGGEVVIGPLVAKLKAMIERHHFEVIIFDPLIKTHAVQENDNAAMDAVADIMAGLAAKYKLSIDAPHHTRKGAGEPGNADVGRGSSATKDAGRLVYTLSKMTEKECATYKGVSETERKYLIRHDPAKVNIAPPSADTKWLRLVSVALGNGTIEYPRGDHVQTVEVWHPTDWLEGVSNERLGELATIIDEGFLHSTGERRYYGDHIQCKDTPRDVFALVAKHLPELNGLQARSLIRTWKKNDTLREEKYLDPEFRRERGCLRLNYHNKPGAIHATET